MGAWAWNIADHHLYWDEQMHRLFGLEPGTFTNSFEAFMQLVVPEDRQRIAKETLAALHQRSDYDGEFGVLWPSDGSTHSIRLRFRVPRLEGEQGGRVIGVAWDVTERRLTEQALARERHLFRTLMDHLPDLIYFKDRESRFIAVNRAMALRFEMGDPANMIGKTDFDIFAPEHALQAHENEQSILLTGKPFVGLEERETWPDGHETWVLTTKMPLHDEQGRICGTFGLSRDITDRKAAEAQLAKFAGELRAKNEVLQQDLDMARELQNAMLPRRSFHFPRACAEKDSAVHFFHFYNPSMTVSGDFFDVLEISSTMAGIFICDVMGHGVRAALVAATVRAVIGELRAAWPHPDQFLTQLNRSLRTTLEHAGIPLFVTAFYVVVDLENGELRYANAGHPTPLRVHHSAGATEPAPLDGIKPGPVLGMFDAQYQNGRSVLAPHDVVLLFTDGLFEVEDAEGEPYDYRQLLGAVTRRCNLPTTELCREVVAEVQQFSASKDFTDDVCLVAIEVDHLLGASYREGSAAS